MRPLTKRTQVERDYLFAVAEAEGVAPVLLRVANLRARGCTLTAIGAQIGKSRTRVVQLLWAFEREIEVIARAYRWGVGSPPAVYLRVVGPLRRAE